MNNFIKKIFKEELFFIFSCPALIWQIFFLFLPIVLLLLYSFISPNFFGLTLDNYYKVFNSLYFQVILNSFILSGSTALICLLIAYPIAYFLVFRIKKYKNLFIFALILPSWTSFIIQVYAWIFLLQKNGLISNFLCKIGIISNSTHLLNNYFSILIGMVYCFLPFMVLPIYTILEKMDKRLLEVSADLGASKIQTFQRVVFPLSLPGILAGFLLVFIPSFGEFAIPDLLGGGKKVFWGTVIADKFLMSRDWKTGSTLTFLGILLLIIFFIISYVISKFLKYYKKQQSL